MKCYFIIICKHFTVFLSEIEDLSIYVTFIWSEVNCNLSDNVYYYFGI